MKALRKMQSFHHECSDLFSAHGFDFLNNLGRRNIVMSHAQEKYFAEVLAETLGNVVSDGRTGQADIFMPDLMKELECKLTSRHKSGCISLQSDYDTLLRKGSLDYLYVIADDSFEEFAVLHFCGLTVDDFRGVSNGSRGKVAMKKHAAMKKCHVLVGEAVNLNDRYVSSYDEKIKNPRIWEKTRKKYRDKIREWKMKPAVYSFELEKIGED